jgi:hypothetical protein
MEPRAVVCDVARMKAITAAALTLALAACSQEPAAPDMASSDAAVAQETTSAEPEPTTLASEPPAMASDAPAAEAASPNALTPQGVGAIVVGQAPPSSLKADATQISESCQTYSDKARRLYAMTDGKVVARVTVMSRSPIKTAEGIGVGTSETAVRKAYPDAVAEPHKYVEAPAKYLDWRPGGGKSGLRFEIDKDGKVSSIHAGREPEIEYVEGCA